MVLFTLLAAAHKQPPMSGPCAAFLVFFSLLAVYSVAVGSEQR